MERKSERKKGRLRSRERENMKKEKIAARGASRREGITQL